MLKRGMEEIFKQNLLRVRQGPRPKTFGEALWNSPLPMKARVFSASPRPSESYSEKVQVLESLERFAQERTEDLGISTLPVQGGGEIVVKKEEAWETRPLENFSDLVLSADQKILDIQLKNKSPEKVKVLFVSEIFRSWDEISGDLKTGFINELITGFPLKTAEFFERMVLAMKLTAPEVILYPVENQGSDTSDEIIQLAAYYKPEVIITLGAKATQKILKGQERLTLIHGQFFQKTLSSGSVFQIVPLFHPSILETNQNMKKTAYVFERNCGVQFAENHAPSQKTFIISSALWFNKLS